MLPLIVLPLKTPAINGAVQIRVGLELADLRHPDRSRTFFACFRPFFAFVVASGRVRPRQRTEICNFGAPSPLDFYEFSPVDSFSFFSPGFLCNLVRQSPQNLEKIARFPGGEKSVESCHVSGCHGFFSVPIAAPSDHLQESPGPSGPKSQKSLKKNLL